MYSTRKKSLLKYNSTAIEKFDHCLVFFLLILPFAMFGQKHYEKGFIVLNNQDTIYGLVKDRRPHPFARLYKKIRFKGKIGSSKYGPRKIRAYKKGDYTFESIWTNETGHFLRQDYTSVPDSGERRFFKVVKKGYLTYYQMEFEDSGSGFVDTIDFFKKQDVDILVRVTQGLLGLKRKRLIRFLSDCPPLVDKLQRKEFKYPIEIANFYNSWKKAQL